MSDSSRIWQAMVVAFLLVASIGGAFYLGSENEPPEPPGPGLPLNTYMMLTYEVSGIINGTELAGSFETQLLVSETGGMSLSTNNVTGNIGENAILPIFPIGSGSYLDNTTMITPWGEKEVLLFITPRMPWDAPLGLSIAYCGAETRLVYHLDHVMEGGRLTYELLDIDVTGMAAMDLAACEDVDEMLGHRQMPNGYDLNMVGVGISGLIQPPDGHTYHCTFNSSGYNFVYFDEQDITSMVQGGEFRYSGETSLFGNGSLEFALEGDQLLYYMAYLDLDAIDPVGHLVIEVGDQ